MWGWTVEAPSHKYSWKQSFYDDRLQDFWVHQGNPVKEISDACKAPRVQGVGWWSPGWRVDLLAGLTRLLLGTCRAAVWVKAVCPELSLRRQGAHALSVNCIVGAEISQPPSVGAWACLRWLHRRLWSMWRKSWFFMQAPASGWQSSVTHEVLIVQACLSCRLKAETVHPWTLLTEPSRKGSAC